MTKVTYLPNLEHTPLKVGDIVEATTGNTFEYLVIGVDNKKEQYLLQSMKHAEIKPHIYFSSTIGWTILTR